MSQINPAENNELASIDEQGRVVINDSTLTDAVASLSDDELEDVAGGVAELAEGPNILGCANISC